MSDWSQWEQEDDQRRNYTVLPLCPRPVVAVTNTTVFVYSISNIQFMFVICRIYYCGIWYVFRISPRFILLFYSVVFCTIYLRFRHLNYLAYKNRIWGFHNRTQLDRKGQAKFPGKLVGIKIIPEYYLIIYIWILNEFLKFALFWF